MTVELYFRSEVRSVGDEAPGLVDGGVAIFFGDPCPEELAELSIVHSMVQVDPQRDPRPGDTLRVGDCVLTISAVGEIAGDNLRKLGHIVVYTNPAPDQNLLPGAIHALGTLTIPTVGGSITLSAGD